MGMMSGSDLPPRSLNHSWRDTECPLGLRFEIVPIILACLVVLLSFVCVLLFLIQERLAGYFPTLSEVFVGWPNSALSSIIFTIAAVVLVCVLTLWASVFDSWNLLSPRLLIAARLLGPGGPLLQVLAAGVTMADNFSGHFVFLSLAVVAYLVFFVIVVAATREMAAPMVSWFRIAIIAIVAVALVGLWVAVGAGRAAGASIGAAICEALCLLGPIAFFCTFRFEFIGIVLNVVAVEPI
jgi:hypothetical protein